MRYRLCIIAATIIWGSSFVIMKDTTSFLTPAWILAIRFLPATLILAAAFLRHRALYFQHEYIVRGLALGVVIFCAYHFQTVGLTDTTPGKNAFLTGTYCVIVPFLAWALSRKRPNRYNVIAAFVCLAGIGLISLDGNLTMRFGDALTLVGALFYALHIVLVARFSPGRNIFVLTLWQFAGMAACAWIVALVAEPLPNLGSISAQGWIALAYLTVIVSAVALLLQNIGQANLPPASAALLLSLESVFGVAFSVALGAEVLTLRVVAGFALVFIAIVISEVLPERMKGSGGLSQ